MGVKKSRIPPGLDNWLDLHAPKLLRWRWIVLSTLGLALSGFFAGSTTGLPRVLCVAGMVVSGLLAATITWARDRTVRINKRKASELAAKLMSTVAGGGQPVILALGELADQPHREGPVQPATVLTQRVLTAGRLWVGEERTENRVAFYRTVGEDRLQYVLYEGRDQKPRHLLFDREDTPLGRSLLEFVHGNGSPHLAYGDVLEECPEGFGNPADASYRSFLTTRVLAGEQVLGILAIDSPSPHNFNSSARQSMLMLAGLLGAGLAIDDQLRQIS